MELHQEKEGRRLLLRDGSLGSQPSLGGLGDPTHTPLSGKVERFLKLGYSQRDIHRVLRSLRPDAQTNDILEELIRTSPGPAHPASVPFTASASTPRLVARGCSHPDSGPRAPSPGTPSPRKTPVTADQSSGFRPVVIDGSNVAMSHGNKKVFSCRGLQLAVMWFWRRGLRDITVFVPLWRQEQSRPDAPITDQHILGELERSRILVYTPSRSVGGRRVACYDDRYVVRLAVESDGVIVSNDNYRDLQAERPQWKKFIEERLLMFTFANDKFMPPDDPLGRNGPTIDSFLRNVPWEQEVKQQHCPYGKKCTYGAKCKFYHPERANQSQLSVADELRAMSRVMPTHQPPAHLDVDLTSMYLSSSSPPPPSLVERAHSSTHPRASLGWGPGEAAAPQKASLDEAFVSLGSSVSGLCLRSSEGLSSGYASGFSGSSGSHSEHCGRGVWETPPSRWSSVPGGGATEETRQSLSALFPPHAVQRVMSTYPHVADVSMLISLIQRNTPLLY